jgi:hypothetical protein
MVPIELYVTEAKLSKSKITMDMGLKCAMQTMVGQQPKNGFDASKIVLKPVSTIPDKTTASVVAVSTYESASNIVTKNFQGQEFGSGSRKIVVQKVALWHKDGKIVIALDVLGSIDGTLYLVGIPNYNSITKEIYFDQLEYVLNTKSILLKSANWLMQETILSKIQENCRYSIKGNLEEGKQSLKPYLTNYSPMKGVFVNGNLTLGENIADLGGLTMSYYALKKSMEGKPAPAKIDGFTAEQRFFISWAQGWRNSSKPEALKMLVNYIFCIGTSSF